MNEPMDIFLGFDPGGKGKGRGNFGWSICKDDTGEFEQVCSGLGKYAEDVVDQVRSKLPSNARVQAAGIDAPMFWDATGKLYRKIDEIIRKAAGISPVSLNGLYGSVLTQGIISAVLLRRHFSALAITEVYPTALRGLLKPLPVELNKHTDETDHERDARIAAYAAWSMYRKASGWWDLFPHEPDSYLPLDPPVSYWMPIDPAKYGASSK